MVSASVSQRFVWPRPTIYSRTGHQALVRENCLSWSSMREPYGRIDSGQPAAKTSLLGVTEYAVNTRFVGPSSGSASRKCTSSLCTSASPRATSHKPPVRSRTFVLLVAPVRTKPKTIATRTAISQIGRRMTDRNLRTGMKLCSYASSASHATSMISTVDRIQHASRRSNSSDEIIS